MSGRYSKALLLLVLAVPALFVLVGGYPQWVVGYLYLFMIQGYVAWLLFFKAGQPFYGYSATMALGAYGCVVLTRTFAMPLPAAILASAVLGALLGAAFILATSRARGFYAGMASFLLAILFPKLIEALYTYTGGRSGVDFSGLNPLIGSDRVFLIIIGTTVVVAGVFVWLMDTRVGKIFTLICENDDLAQAVGIDTLRYKVLVYTIAGLVSGLGGALYVNYIRSISSVDINVFTTVIIFFIPLLGGRKSIFGVPVGAVFVVLLPELFADVERYIEILFGLAYIIVMVFLPDGIVTSIQRLVKAIYDRARLQSVPVTSDR